MRFLLPMSAAGVFLVPTTARAACDTTLPTNTLVRCLALDLAAAQADIEALNGEVEALHVELDAMDTTRLADLSAYLEVPTCQNAPEGLYHFEANT